MSDDKKFEPLIKKPKSTLKERKVEIKDTMNFERRPTVMPQPSAVTAPMQQAPVSPEKRDMPTDKDTFRKTTMKTQKMSLDVLLKLEILDPFLRSVEDLEMEKKISINDKIDILIDSYLSTKLSTRQLEGFKAIYENFTR